MFRGKKDYSVRNQREEEDEKSKEVLVIRSVQFTTRESPQHSLRFYNVHTDTTVIRMLRTWHVEAKALLDVKLVVPLEKIIVYIEEKRIRRACFDHKLQEVCENLKIELKEDTEINFVVVTGVEELVKPPSRTLRKGSKHTLKKKLKTVKIKSSIRPLVLSVEEVD